MVFRSPRIGASLFLCFAFRFRVIVFALRFHAFCHVLFLRHVPRFIFALPALVVASFLLDGAGVRFSMGVFSLSVDATCVASGLGAGLLLGLVGSLPPTIRCLRTSIPTALKSDLV